ncbi:MAG: hypothetical protein ABFD13_05875 [Candidatus Cryosericum sp.]
MEQKTDRLIVQKALAQMPYVTRQNLGVLLDVSAATLNYRVQRMKQTGELIPLRAELSLTDPLAGKEDGSRCYLRPLDARRVVVD